MDVGIGGVGIEGKSEGLGRFRIALEGEEGVGDGEVGLCSAGRVRCRASGLGEGVFCASKEDQGMGSGDAGRDGLGILGEDGVQEGKALLGTTGSVGRDGELVEEAGMVWMKLEGALEELQGEVGSAHAAEFVGLGELVGEELHVLGGSLGPSVGHGVAGGGGAEGEGDARLVGASDGAEGLAQEEVGGPCGAVDGEGALQEREGFAGLAGTKPNLAEARGSAPFLGSELREAREGGLGVGQVAQAQGGLADAVPCGREVGEVPREGLELGEGGLVVGLFLEGHGRVQAREGFVRGHADDVEEGLPSLRPEAIGGEGKCEGRAAGGVARGIGDEGRQSLEVIAKLRVEGLGSRGCDDGQEGRATREVEGDGDERCGGEGTEESMDAATRRGGRAWLGRGGGHDGARAWVGKQKVARGLREPPFEGP